MGYHRTESEGERSGYVIGRVAIIKFHPESPNEKGFIEFDYESCSSGPRTSRRDVNSSLKNIMSAVFTIMSKYIESDSVFQNIHFGI